MELFYSRLSTVVATLVVAYAAFCIGYLALFALLGGNVIFLIYAGGGALFGALLLMPFAKAVVHAWRHTGPVVILDIDGVTDVRKTHAFIPWEDIGQISLGVGETASFLCIDFKKTDRAREDAPRLFGVGLLLKRARSLGDWNITLRLLKCRRTEVLRQARLMRQQALRRQIIEMNKSNPQGWSGTL